MAHKKVENRSSTRKTLRICGEALPLTVALVASTAYAPNVVALLQESIVYALNWFSTDEPPEHVEVIDVHYPSLLDAITGAPWPLWLLFYPCALLLVLHWWHSDRRAQPSAAEDAEGEGPDLAHLMAVFSSLNSGLAPFVANLLAKSACAAPSSERQSEPADGAERFLANFRTIRAEWLKYEMDPASTWEVPELLDVRVAETAAFHDAFEAASTLLDSQDGVTDAPRFGEAVERMGKAWVAALTHAEVSGRSTFTDEQNRLADRMKALNAHAARRDSAAETENARRALERVRGEWEASIGLPRKTGHAALALVDARRRALAR